MKPTSPYRLGVVTASHAGFTLVELVVVIVVVGILGAAAASRYFDRNTGDSRAFADQSAFMVRYAQKVAVAQNRNVWVLVAPAGIKLCYTAACGAADYVAAPGGSNSGTGASSSFCSGSASWACEAPPSGISFGTTLSFYFDGIGKPFSAGGAWSAAQNISVLGGPAARSFTVEMETGYVH